MKTRLQLIVTFTTVLIVGFGSILFWVLSEVRHHYLESMEETLIDMAAYVAADITEQSKEYTIDLEAIKKILSNAYDLPFIARIGNTKKQHVDVRIYITDAEGMVLFDSDNNWALGKDYSEWNDVYLTLQKEYGARLSVNDPYDPGSPYMYVAAPIILDKEIVGVVSLGKPLHTMNRFVKDAKVRYLAVGFGVSMILIALGALFVRLIMRPITQVTAYAAAVRDNKDVVPPLAAFSNKTRKDEIHTLAHTIMQMRDSLEGKQKNEHYLQALMHELKTPITAIATSAELLKGTPDLTKEELVDFVTGISLDAERLNDITKRINELALLESHSRHRIIEQIDLCELCKASLAIYKPILEENKLHLKTILPAKAPYKGEGFSLRLAISNVLKNAIDFTPESGTVTVKLVKEDKNWIVIFEDTGPGVPNELVGKVFDRFFSTHRPDTGERSTGIGLTYVRETVNQHGGKVTLCNKPEGGFQVKIILPKSQTLAI